MSLIETKGDVNELANKINPEAKGRSTSYSKFSI